MLNRYFLYILHHSISVQKLFNKLGKLFKCHWYLLQIILKYEEIDLPRGQQIRKTELSFQKYWRSLLEFTISWRFPVHMYENSWCIYFTCIQDSILCKQPWSNSALTSLQGWYRNIFIPSFNFDALKHCYDNSCHLNLLVPDTV